MTQNKRSLFNKKDLLAYLFVAGTGAIVQLICGSLLQDWFGVSYAWSLQIAYQISLVVGFILTKMFAFDVRNTEKTQREMVKFIMVSQFSGLVMTLTALAAFNLSNIFFYEMKISIPNSHNGTA